MNSISADAVVSEGATKSVALMDENHSYQAIKTILNSLDALVYVSDMQTYDLLYINDYGAAEWGPVAGRKCYQVLQAGQDSPCHFCTNHKLLDTDGKPSGVYVWEFQNTINGRWYQCRDQAIYWVDGRLVRIEIATDITDRKHMEQQLADAKALAERQANTDELTQLYNRRAFFTLSRQVLLQAHRGGQSLAVVMFDLDHFKQVNDQWNHAAGDAVLVNISALAQNIVRGSDVLARVGGEEFAMVLPDTDVEQARQLAERMRVGFEQHKIVIEGGEISCTASFGIACANLAELTTEFEPQIMLENLLHKADQAMMQAKVSGRNRVCMGRVRY
ncbi:GGDEF domain-containing protein [Rheinheimera sp. 1928-s]|uniref:sensor domain-containing diguanylate cyclase n=1 Tax=Rheinheimera sp. 1928-s TaxID=3033803 RepID=UPI002622F035|nr:GGDEF domain-containing protein [Rheinheimera sp. 1928-s]MDF3125942.1 GGDEF domain-containing protein [Rheinheimera sp. 1928-s]